MTPPEVSGIAETVLDGVPDVVAVGDEAVLEGSIFEVKDAINELRVVDLDLTHLIQSIKYSQVKLGKLLKGKIS